MAIISVQDVMVGELSGSLLGNTVDIVVTLDAPSLSTVTVDYTTAAGTALSGGVDFTGGSGTLSFAAGETSKVVSITLSNDLTVENLEHFHFQLSSPTNATLGQDDAMISIVDNDTAAAQPALSVRDVVVDEKSGTASFVVAMDASTLSPVTVNYAIAGGTATTGSDYAAGADPLSGTLSFAAGETAKTVTVNINDDALAEAAERFNLVLSNASNATIRDGRGVAVIGASDATAALNPTISAADQTLSEADGYVDMVLSLSTPSSQAVSVNYDMVAGTASALSDYIHESGTVYFASGETTKTLRIELTDNLIQEATESFQLRLTGATNATVGTFLSTITVVDNDNGIKVHSGGISDDVYTVSAASDLVVENLGGGMDQVRSAISYTLGANQEALVLTGAAAINGTGNSLANRLTGNAANNKLTGGAGRDTLIGGLGNDTYVISNSNEVLVEAAAAGTDGVLSSVSYTLAANLEKLTLTGAAATNGTGNSLANTLTGNAAKNMLSGGNGNDTLNGGAGVDTLIGGLGNDTYVLTHAGEVITELAAAGTDSVLSSVSYTLAANLEKLTLTGAAAINGSGNGLANTLIGNAANNVLTGGSGNDTLNGGAGVDTLIGGLGNDTYVVTNAGEVITEAAAAGTDSVRSTVSHALAANLERLTLTGTAAINGSGNSLANTLIGNTANNALKGGAGADTLTGGGGADAFVFNSKTGSDLITDFLSGTDTLRISQAGLRIGDGDTVIDGSARIAGPGGFAAANELVIVTGNIAGAITTASAAAAIGSAGSAYAAGATRLFAVDNGTSSGLFLFTSSAANAAVSAAELTLLGVVGNTATTAVADYQFVA